MASLATQNPSVSGVALTFANCAGGGDSFFNNGFEFLMFKNSSGAGIDVTIDAPGVDNFGFSGNALDRVVSIPNNATHFMVGPFQTARHNDANGRVQLSYASAPGATFQVAVVGR